MKKTNKITKPFLIIWDDAIVSFRAFSVRRSVAQQGLFIPVAFSLKNKTETALAITNSTSLFKLALLSDQNPIDYHRMRHGRKFSRPGIYFLIFFFFFFAKLTVDKQNDREFDLCMETNKKE